MLPRAHLHALLCCVLIQPQKRKKCLREEKTLLEAAELLHNFSYTYNPVKIHVSPNVMILNFTHKLRLWFLFKGTVHPKVKIQSLSTLLHAPLSTKHTWSFTAKLPCKFSATSEVDGDLF